MNLLVGFYDDPVSGRMDEFVECVRRNASNPHIDSIAVFVEDSISPADLKSKFPALAQKKIRLLEHGRRLTYSHLFEHANRHFAGDGVIIANADIYFDETVAQLDDEPLAHRMLCLSRWDENSDGTARHLDRPDSQDAWVFEPPVPAIAADFFLGKPGCDNRLAFEAERAGLAVSNPSRSVRARHLHQSGVRRYSQRERVNGPVRFVPASFLPNDHHPVGSSVSLIQGFPSHRGTRARCMVNARYQEIHGSLARHFDGRIPRNLRRELLRAISVRIEGPPRPPGPLASVAFRDPMGYTLARLEPGISTHNNDSRPLVSIPKELAGLSFTQVVSCHSAPVAIEFRTSGKVFVLAAPGWEGYAPAAAFLDDAGWREPIEPLRTSVGTIFEAWSLSANGGERLTLPVQVMLAGADLSRMD